MQRLTFPVLLVCFVALGTAQRWTREHFNDPHTFRGPFSDAVRVGNTMYVSGLHADHPGNLTFSEETREVLNRMRLLVEAGRLTLQHVAKTSVYLTNWNDYGEMNQIYREYFPEKFPARSALQVVRLPLGAHVQIEAVAVYSDL